MENGYYSHVTFYFNTDIFQLLDEEWLSNEEMLDFLKNHIDLIEDYDLGCALDSE